MKAIENGREKFVTDARGKRVGVLLDLKTYQALREAAEEQDDVRAYDAAKDAAHEDLRNRRTVSIHTYMARRKKK